MKTMVTLTLALLVTAGLAQAADWPQFRGLNRDGLSAEKGLLQSWSEGGPKKVMEAGDLGQGYSSLAIAKGKIFTTGLLADKTLAVTALDLEGKKLWQIHLDKGAPASGKEGSRATPTVDGERLYVLGDNGTIYCLSADKGDKVWSVNLVEKYGAKMPTWAFAESVLILGDLAIVAPGGQASLVALDKKTGKEVWTTPPVDPVTAYASAVVIDYKGLKQIVSFTGKSVFGVNAADGKLLWKAPHVTKYDVNATSVVFNDGILFVCSGYGTGGEGFKMEVADGKATVKSLYKAPMPDDQMGGIVLADGVLYGTSHMSKEKGLTALKLASGEKVFTNAVIGQSSWIYADGRLYGTDYDGTVRLMDPKDGKVVGSFKLVASGPMWAHPAISDSRLYVRNGPTLTAYDIKAK